MMTNSIVAKHCIITVFPHCKKMEVDRNKIFTTVKKAADSTTFLRA